MTMSDLKRWQAMWQTLGAKGDGRALLCQLRAAYDEPQRVYHTLAHMRDCLRQFDAARTLAEQPAEVEVAIWFHDAVYDTHRSDNEERSAEWAERALVEAGAPDPVPRRVQALILATRHDLVPTGQDAALLADVDLSILGRTPAEYDAYEQGIRQEYAWVPDETYRAARANILRGLLLRARLYQTDFFYQRYEDRARRNLERALLALLAG
jgi:predicted metal-dependent HD superfamily phosphohydrolase